MKPPHAGEVIAAVLVVIGILMGIAVCAKADQVDRYNRAHRTRSTLEIR